MKKSLKVALVAVCLMAAGAFFMGCSSPSGGGGFTPKYAVGDIVLNDGTKVAYSVAKDYSGDDLINLQSKAVAVIFKAATESKPALGVGIKHNKSGLAWCKDSNVNGCNVKFTDTVVTPEGEAGSFTFTGKTDGSDNFMIMARTLDNQGKNDTGLKSSNNYALPAKDESTGSEYSTLKTNYPAFEFAYYYGKNGHNITSGSTFENGWYLPSESELNDIYQANKTDNVIENALGVTGGDKFEGLNYWSSSQYASYVNNAYRLGFNDGDWDYHLKNYSNYVCAVRAFN
ncbi:MAG: DUF1566 domain-containing protein [Treponema sp.]|nr:DUF1566 domain-containing protein [Candidatus Treponema scatequi]